MKCVPRPTAVRLCGASIGLLAPCRSASQRATQTRARSCPSALRFLSSNQIRQRRRGSMLSRDRRGSDGRAFRYLDRARRGNPQGGLAPALRTASGCKYRTAIWLTYMYGSPDGLNPGRKRDLLQRPRSHCLEESEGRRTPNIRPPQRGLMRASDHESTPLAVTSGISWMRQRLKISFLCADPWQIPALGDLDRLDIRAVIAGSTR